MTAPARPLALAEPARHPPQAVPARAGIRAVSASLLDQCLLSATSFAIGMLLIRTTSKSEFARYTLGVSTLLLLVGVQNAVITTPMTVLLPGKRGAARPAFLRSLLAGQATLSLALVAAAAGALALPRAVGSGFAAVLLLAGAATLPREFARALFLAEIRPGQTLLLDVVFVLALAAAWAVTLLAGPPGAATALAVLAAAAAVAAAVGLVLVRPALAPGSASPRPALAETWRHGRWALLGVVGSWVQTQSYVYVVGWLAGADRIAELSAARLFLMPVGLVTAGLGSVVVPHGAQLLAAGERAPFRRLVRWSTAGLLGLVVAYTAFLHVAFRPEVAALVLTPAYAASARRYVVPWGLVFAATAARSGASNALIADRRFRGLAGLGAAAAAVTLAASGVLVATCGPGGSVAAVLLGELTLGALCWRALGRERT